MTDLSLVLVDDLWEELKKRYDGVVLVSVKTIDKDNEERRLDWHGGKFVCIGLAEFAKEAILESMFKDD